MEELDKDSIEFTKFYIALNHEFIDVLRRKMDLIQKSGISFSKAESELSEADQRIDKTFNRFIILRDHLKDIKSNKGYLNLMDLDEFLKKNNIEKSEYSRFIYESHQIRVVSTPDIMAKLGNVVCNTGIPRRYCNWNSFIKHKSVKGTECAKILDDFSTTLWADKIERNEIVHVGGYKHSLIESIWSTELDDEQIGNDPLLKKYFSKERTESVKKLIEQMNQNYDLTLKYAKKFVESLTGELRKSLKDDPQQTA